MTKIPIYDRAPYQEFQAALASHADHITETDTDYDGLKTTLYKNKEGDLIALSEKQAYSSMHRPIYFVVKSYRET